MALTDKQVVGSLRLIRQYEANIADILFSTSTLRDAIKRYDEINLLDMANSLKDERLNNLIRIANEIIAILSKKDR